MRKNVEKLPYIGDYKKTPKFMLHNKHILRGYRINFDSHWKLFKSLFWLHNETINVWSHLMGMFLFFYILAHTFNRYEPIDFYDQITAQKSLNFQTSTAFQKIHDELEHLKIDSEKVYSKIVNQILDSSKLDEQNEKINDGKGNLFLFWQQKKAKHGSQLEALDLYI